MRSRRKRFYHRTVVVRDLFSDNTVFLCAVLIAAGIFISVAAKISVPASRNIIMYTFSEVFTQKETTSLSKNFYDHMFRVFPAMRTNEALRKKYAAKYGGIKKEYEAKKNQENTLSDHIKPLDMSSKGLTFRNETAYTPDASALLNTPLDFHLESGSPKVLIMHTHTSESYAESDGARTTDASKNVVRVGEVIKNTLKENGISVLHDTTQNDVPSYNGSYNKALKNIAAQIEKHPSIEVVLDIHRDYAEQTKEDGTKVQLKPVTTVDGEAVAQVMFVVGTDARGLEHPNWKHNLAFSIQVQNKLNAFSPSIARPINLRRERFNQHLTKGSLIVEVGTAGNTIKECEKAGVYIGKAIASVLKEYR